MKNHIKVNGRLLQTNKTFKHLKLRQKEWIVGRMRELYIDFVLTNGRKPNKLEKRELVNKVYALIEEREIWIPFNEVKNKFSSKITRFDKSIRKMQSTDTENINI